VYPPAHPVHVVQSVVHTDDDPTMELHIPVAQVVQSPSPLTVVYVPALHCIQLPALVALYVPAVHSVHTLEPGVLNVPARQFMQAVEPVADFQVPASQAVHAVPSAPVYRARHVQIELFSIENVLAGHTVQFLAAADEYVFALHGVHIPAPVVFLYVPAGHTVHATEPVMVLYVP
jgi:hypothetical protein